MATSTDEALLEEIARQPVASFSEAAENFRLSLYKSDAASYHAFEEAFYPSDIVWGSAKHKLGIMAAFKSPLYSDACKEYFAASNLRDQIIFSAAADFLTEKIIFSSIERPTAPLLSLSYFAALMGSEHLSERIMLATIHKVNIFDIWMALELIPASMIKPEVVSSWLDKASGGARGSFITPKVKVAVVLRIKQAHPEYEGFPDDWVLKVFCGW